MRVSTRTHLSTSAPVRSPPTRFSSALAGDHRVDGRTTVVGQPDQRGPLVRGVGDGLDQAVRRRLVDHPLHELTAERLHAPHLGTVRALRAQEIQDGAHADGKAFDRLVQLHLAAHAPVQGPSTANTS